MKLTPRPYQEDDINAVLAHPSKGAVIASVVGTGKTLVGVEIIRRAGTELNVIIAPPNTYDSWARTWHGQTGEELLRVTTKTQRERNNFIALADNVPGTYFVGWEQARRKDTKPILENIQTVIGDEAHRAANRKTSSHELWLYACAQSRLNGGYCVAMSATPWGNKPSGAFGVTTPIWPELAPNRFWAWANKYINIQKQEIETALATKTVRVLTNEKKSGSIVADLPLYIRHEKNYPCCVHHPDGVQSDLPQRIFHDIFVELTPTQRKIYKQLEQNMFAWIEENEWPLDSDGYPMVNAMRLHQVTLAVPTTEMVQKLKTNKWGEKELVDSISVRFENDCKSSKIDAVLETLSDLPEDERVLIFTHSTALVPALVHRINKQFGEGVAGEWTGHVTGSARAELKEAFIDGSGPRIIVAQISAISEGVDGLQHVCSTEIWVSATDNGIHNTQAKGRLLRDGQTSPVNAYRIMAKDTIEERQMERLFMNDSSMTEGLHVR